MLARNDRLIIGKHGRESIVGIEVPIGRSKDFAAAFVYYVNIVARVVLACVIDRRGFVVRRTA